MTPKARKVNVSSAKKTRPLTTERERLEAPKRDGKEFARTLERVKRNIAKKRAEGPAPTPKKSRGITLKKKVI